MALSAYFVEDPVTRIVSITIGVAAGAVVLMSQEIADDPAVLGKRYVGRPAKEPPPPQDWKLVSENATAFRAQTFALVPNPAEPTKPTPTYLLGAAWIDKAEIHRSLDGEHWTVVYSEPLDGGFGFTGLVWNADDKAFYAALYGRDGGDDIAFEAKILKSLDGISWTQDQLFQAFDNADFIPQYDAATAAFRAHCTKPENRGGIPDGFQAWDGNNEIFMKPTALYGWELGGVGVSSYAGGITIEGTGAGGGEAQLPPGVLAVSFAGGVWNALIYPFAGAFFTPTEIWFSNDNGKSWARTFETTGYFPAGISSGAETDVGAPT